MTKLSVSGTRFKQGLAGTRRHIAAGVEKLQLVLDNPGSPAVYLLIGEVSLAMSRALIEVDRLEQIVREDPKLREEKDGG